MYPSATNRQTMSIRSHRLAPFSPVSVPFSTPLSPRLRPVFSPFFSVYCFPQRAREIFEIDRHTEQGLVLTQPSAHSLQPYRHQNHREKMEKMGITGELPARSCPSRAPPAL